jgi:hypothetical protein
MRVYKYTLKPETRQVIEMPKGAEILSTGVDVLVSDNLCLWALVDEDARPEMRTIRIHGTGHDVPESSKLRFIGTAFMRQHSLVWHVFEEV